MIAFLLLAALFWRSLRWLPLACRRRYWRHGHPACKPPSARRNNRKPDWVVDKVIHIRACNPRLSYEKTALTFNRLHAARGMTVCTTYVYYTALNHRHRIEMLRRHLKRRIPRPMARNRIWGLDLTGKADVRGSIHAILGIVDHGSRLPMRLAALANKSSWTILGHLFLAIGRFGKPWAVRTDNESVFVSRIVRLALGSLGIRHQRIPPGQPWLNGRIERFFGTLKQSLDLWRVADRFELQRALLPFVDWYSNIRPHAHLAGATPAEAWYGIDPYAITPRAVEWFEAWDGLLTGYRIRR